MEIAPLSAEKAQLLSSRNMAASLSAKEAYYINKARGKVNYEEWDESQASWMWQMYYNSEKTIVELKQTLESVHPIESTEKLSQILQQPIYGAYYQASAIANNMKILVDSVSKLNKTVRLNDVEEYRTRMLDVDYPRSKPVNSAFNKRQGLPSLMQDINLYGTNSHFVKGYISAHNAIAKVITARINANVAKSVTLKVSGSDLPAIEAVKVEFQNLQAEALSLRNANKEFGDSKQSYAEAQFELWEKTLNSLDAEQKEFLDAFSIESSVSAEEVKIESLEKLKLSYDNTKPDTTIEFEATLDTMWDSGPKDEWLAGLANLDNKWVENAESRVARIERLINEYKKIIDFGSYKAYNTNIESEG